MELEEIRARGMSYKKIELGRGLRLTVFSGKAVLAKTERQPRIGGYRTWYPLRICWRGDSFERPGIYIKRSWDGMQ